jgi:arginyl-tRNA--protein-N-Asp/Glu arginylyltransferase
MNGSPHLIIGYWISGEFRMQVKEGWSPSYELRGHRDGTLTISMADCKDLALITIVRVGK